MPALQLTADDHLSRRIDAVDLKHRLGDVETDCRDRLHAWLPITATAPAAITQWHLRAGGGAVHSIKSGLCHPQIRHASAMRIYWRTPVLLVQRCVDRVQP